MAKPDIHALATKYLLIQTGAVRLNSRNNARYKVLSKIRQTMVKRFGQKKTCKSIEQAETTLRLFGS